MTQITSAVVSLVAGAILPFGFAPYSLWVIPFLSLAMLFYLWWRASPAVAFRNGYWFGLGCFGNGVSWLHISINLFGGINLFAAVFITFALVAFLSLYPALAGWSAKRFLHVSGTQFFFGVAPTIWVLSEWLRSWLLSGFPWLVVGYSQADTLLRGFAPVFGVFGISWTVALLAGIFGYVYDTRGRRTWPAIVLLLGTAVIAWCCNQYPWVSSSGKTLSVALIQGAVPQELKWRPAQRQPTYDLYTDLSAPYWDADIIVWPETAVPALYSEAQGFVEQLQTLANRHETDLFVGIPVLSDGRFFNSMMYVNDAPAAYNKRHLVPFGEFLPLKPVLNPVVSWLKIPIADFFAGTTPPLLKGRRVTAGVSICYEDAFGQEVADALPDAEVLINISNDAWFGDSAAPHQHLQMARMRALESGRYMLRATNTGISAIIDPSGTLVASGPQFQPAAVTGVIYPFSGLTPYARFGDVPAGCVLLLLLVLYHRSRRALSRCASS